MLETILNYRSLAFIAKFPTTLIEDQVNQNLFFVIVRIEGCRLIQDLLKKEIFSCNVYL